MKYLHISFTENKAIREEKIFALSDRIMSELKAYLDPVLKNAPIVVSDNKLKAVFLIGVSDAFLIKNKIGYLLSINPNRFTNEEKNTLKMLQDQMSVIFERGVNQYHEPNIYTGGFCLSVSTPPLKDTNPMGVLYA